MPAPATTTVNVSPGVTGRVWFTTLPPLPPAPPTPPPVPPCAPIAVTDSEVTPSGTVHVVVPTVVKGTVVVAAAGSVKDEVATTVVTVSASAVLNEIRRRRARCLRPAVVASVGGHLMVRCDRGVASGVVVSALGSVPPDRSPPRAPSRRHPRHYESAFQSATESGRLQPKVVYELGTFRCPSAVRRQDQAPRGDMLKHEAPFSTWLAETGGERWPGGRGRPDAKKGPVSRPSPSSRVGEI